LKIRPVSFRRLPGGDKKAINILFRTVGLNLTTITHWANYGQDRIQSSPITGYSHWHDIKPGSRNTIDIETVYLCWYPVEVGCLADIWKSMLPLSVG
jgi:hypothetical protein